MIDDVPDVRGPNDRRFGKRGGKDRTNKLASKRLPGATYASPTAADEAQQRRMRSTAVKVAVAGAGALALYSALPGQNCSSSTADANVNQGALPVTGAAGQQPAPQKCRSSGSSRGWSSSSRSWNSSSSSSSSQQAVSRGGFGRSFFGGGG